MYPYMFGWWFLGVLLIVVVPLLVLFVLELVFAAMPPTENAALRIATERLARREIDKEQVGLLMNAL